MKKYDNVASHCVCHMGLIIPKIGIMRHGFKTLSWKQWGFALLSGFEIKVEYTEDK